MKKYIPLIIILVIIDQLIKFIIISTIASSGVTISLIPGVLELSYVENIGAAWGLIPTRIFLIGLDIMIIFAIIKLSTNKQYELEENVKLGFSLILAGGIGNLLDRIFRGYVIDYIDINNILNYPVFNFADICIVVGIILVFIIIIKNTIKKQETINEKV